MARRAIFRRCRADTPAKSGTSASRSARSSAASDGLAVAARPAARAFRVSAMRAVAGIARRLYTIACCTPVGDEQAAPSLASGHRRDGAARRARRDRGRVRARPRSARRGRSEPAGVPLAQSVRARADARGRQARADRVGGDPASSRRPLPRGWPGAAGSGRAHRWLIFMTNTVQTALMRFIYPERYGGDGVRDAAAAELREHFGRLEGELEGRDW